MIVGRRQHGTGVNTEKVTVSDQYAQRIRARGGDGRTGKLQAFRFESTAHDPREEICCRRKYPRFAGEFCQRYITALSPLAPFTADNDQFVVKKCLDAQVVIA